MARQGSAAAKKAEGKGLKKYYKKKADESRGAKKAQTPAVRKKESAAAKRAQTPAVRKREAAAMKGKGKTQARRDGRGAPGKPKSASHRAAISAALKAYWKKRKGKKVARKPVAKTPAKKHRDLVNAGKKANKTLNRERKAGTEKKGVGKVSRRPKLPGRG